MNDIQYIAKDVTLNETIKAYTEEKLSLLGKMVADKVAEIRYEVEFSKENPPRDDGAYRADITIHAGAVRKHAVGRGSSLHAALDVARDELERRLRREKRKKMTVFKRGARKLKDLLRFGR